MNTIDWNFWLTIATVVAIIAGPLIALEIERRLDDKRAKRKRQQAVFTDLLRTRGIRLDAVHVSALNVVEVEFYEDATVRTEFKNYISHLSSPMPAVTQQERYFEERNDRFLDLLDAIGKSLGYVFDKHELGRLSYVPQGWEDDQATIRRNARLLSEVLAGERALPIAQHNTAGGPFPEPPK